MSELDRQISEAFRMLFAQSEDRQIATDELHKFLKGNGKLSKVTLHRYMCKRGCQIATVFRADGRILCAVRDYKFSPGLNEKVSVPAARERNTLDGNKHWPGHVYDVEWLSVGDQKAGMDMNCRHRMGAVFARDILATVEGVIPGKPGAPTIL